MPLNLDLPDGFNESHVPSQILEFLEWVSDYPGHLTMMDMAMLQEKAASLGLVLNADGTLSVRAN